MVALRVDDHWYNGHSRTAIDNVYESNQSQSSVP